MIEGPIRAIGRKNAESLADESSAAAQEGAMSDDDPYRWLSPRKMLEYYLDYGRGH